MTKRSEYEKWILEEDCDNCPSVGNCDMEEEVRMIRERLRSSGVPVSKIVDKIISFKRLSDKAEEEDDAITTSDLMQELARASSKLIVLRSIIILMMEQFEIIEFRTTKKEVAEISMNTELCHGKKLISRDNGEEVTLILANAEKGDL